MKRMVLYIIAIGATCLSSQPANAFDTAKKLGVPPENSIPAKIDVPSS